MFNMSEAVPEEGDTLETLVDGHLPIWGYTYD